VKNRVQKLFSPFTMKSVDFLKSGKRIFQKIFAISYSRMKKIFALKNNYANKKGN